MAESEMERFAERVARVIGPQSAAAQALANLQERRERGEDVELALAGNAWFVVPAAIIERHP